jgi:hypothetical protein
MWFRPSVRDRVIGFASRIYPAALALPLLLPFAVPAAVAQPSKTQATELEQRVLDIATMFQNDPRYNKGKTPQQIKDGVEFVNSTLPVTRRLTR